MRTLIRGARLVATMDDGRRRIPGGWVLVEDATIAAVGDGEPPKDAAPDRIPTGDELAEELERYLREMDDPK